MKQEGKAAFTAADDAFSWKKEDGWREVGTRVHRGKATRRGREGSAKGGSACSHEILFHTWKKRGGGIRALGTSSRG